MYAASGLARAAPYTHARARGRAELPCYPQALWQFLRAEFESKHLPHWPSVNSIIARAYVSRVLSRKNYTMNNSSIDRHTQRSHGEEGTLYRYKVHIDSEGTLYEYR